MMIIKTIPKLASLLLIVIASCLLTKIFYIEAKAIIAQYLLIRSWEESKKTQSKVKPWAWADIHPVGSLKVPRLTIYQIILSGQSGEALAFGPGEIKIGSAISLAGHRDSHFKFLEFIKVGDKIELEDLNTKEQLYEVNKIYIQDTQKEANLKLKENTLSLVTCYPFDSAFSGGPLRYVVEAVPANNSPLVTREYQQPPAKEGLLTTAYRL